LRVAVRPDQLAQALATMTPIQVGAFMQLVLWMAINASPLPGELQACCEIVKARSNEARRTVAELTGLDPVGLSTVDGHGRQNLSTVDESVYGRRHGRQGVAFEGSPEAGLTLRSDRAWGIDPISAESIAAHERRVRMEKQQRYRAKKAARSSTVDEEQAVDGRLAGAGNSKEYRNTENTEERVLLPSVVAHAVRAREGEHVREGEAGDAGELGTAAGRRRGEALKAMRACGLTGINGLHPEFLALLATGITDDELRWGAEDAVAKGKGFPYAVAALLRSRQDAVAGTPAPIPSERPLSAWEARARELAGPSAIGYKPPT
jgi:hypothetical protein